jgi:hypothetical protein
LPIKGINIAAICNTWRFPALLAARALAFYISPYHAMRSISVRIIGKSIQVARLSAPNIISSLAGL